MHISREGVNSDLKSRRTDLGLSVEEVASACEMTVHEYRDLEDYDDEVFMVVQLSVLHCICKKLKISLCQLFNLSVAKQVDNFEIIGELIKRNHISVNDLSDNIGIEVKMIESIQCDILNLDDWVMDPIIDLCEILNVNITQVLSAYENRKCESR